MKKSGDLLIDFQKKKKKEKEKTARKFNGF